MVTIPLEEFTPLVVISCNLSFTSLGIRIEGVLVVAGE
jgi:hypothetical protein